MILVSVKMLKVIITVLVSAKNVEDFHLLAKIVCQNSDICMILAHFWHIGEKSEHLYHNFGKFQNYANFSPTPKICQNAQSFWCFWSGQKHDFLAVHAKERMPDGQWICQLD